MKKILTITALLFLTNIQLVYASDCDSNEINNLKEVANKVEINYVGVEPYKKINYITNKEYTVYDDYEMTINNFTSDIYILVDDYEYKNISDIATDGVFVYPAVGGKIAYHIYSTKCDTLLRDVELYLPMYNYYSYYDECKGINALSLKECAKWVKEEDYEYFKNLTEEQFLKTVDKYNNKNIINKTTDFIKDNIIYFSIGLGSLILVGIIIVIIILKRKRGRLE